MASITTHDGRRAIQFTGADGRRKTLRLGVISQRDAESVRGHVERLLQAAQLGTAAPPDVLAWVATLGDSPYSRLARVGLVASRENATLGAFVNRVRDNMTGKESTRTSDGHTLRNLADYFSDGKRLRDIAPADADAWRVWLVEHEKLSQPTIARRVVACRTLWRRAIRWGLASVNPFVGVKAGHQANEARKAFVPRETIDRVLAQVPDTEWRVIIALSRYGGLRCPSEIYALRWGDLDWERGALRVPCPKLAHIESCAFRTVPLFPELRVPLLELFAEAEPGTEHVITRHRLGCENLRQQLMRFITRAGLKPWPKLFHNLRASRETELMREYDLATVCKWIGNSPAIAAKHYAMSIDLNADFARATGGTVEATQKATQQASALARTAQPPKTAHGDNTSDCEHLRDSAEKCENGQPYPMGDTGLEPVTSCMSSTRSSQLS